MTDINFDVKQNYGFYYLGIPADKKAEQDKVRQIKAEWPRRYPYIESYKQESLDRAKEGWTKTGKVYHLLSQDEKGYSVTHEYPEYFDGENKFIVVKEYNTFYIHKVTPVTWEQDREGFLCFNPSDSLNLLADFIDLPTNLGTPGFDEKTLREYFNQFFAKEMIVDQRYEKEPHVLTTELANKNYDLTQKNAKLTQENDRLTQENNQLTQKNNELEKDKSDLEKQVKELTEKLKTVQEEDSDKEKKLKEINNLIKDTNFWNIGQLREKTKNLGL